MEIIDWKKHTMKLGKPDPATVTHCPSCGVSVEWNPSWDTRKLVFYCPECGKYLHDGRVISDEEADKLADQGD